MLLFWWAGSLTARLLSESLVYQRLESEANTILAALELSELSLEPPRFGEAKLNPTYDIPYSGKYYIVHLADGEDLVSRSMWEQDLDIALLTPGEQLRTQIAGVAGEPILMWAGGFSKNGYSFTIVVAEDIVPIRERLTIFKLYFAAISLVLLLSLLAVQHVIVRWSVKKLDRLTLDIRKLEHGRVGALSEDVPAEVLPVVQEFNRLLALFDQRLRHSRNAVGNLAHSLKGPLHLLLRASEVDGEDVNRLTHAEVRAKAGQIHLLIERELKRARLAGRSTAGVLFDAKRELPPLAGLLRQVYSDKKVDIAYDIRMDAELLFDREDMLELIGNLLDNAYKWASTRVSFSMYADNGTVIRVEDDGPGCSDEELWRLTGRGTRLDESVAGHGLGLSIVKDVVDTYGGELVLDRSEVLGGFRATVRLPSNASANISPHNNAQAGASGPG